MTGPEASAETADPAAGEPQPNPELVRLADCRVRAHAFDPALSRVLIAIIDEVIAQVKGA